MKEIICIDTQILIWALKEEAEDSEQNKNMIRWAKLFLKELERQENIKVIIPSIVIAELMSHVKPEKHNQAMETISNNFKIASFNTPSAMIYGKLWQENREDIKRFLDSKEISEAHIKFDYQIIATALSHRADCIYSYDAEMKNLAKDYIEIKKMPSVQEDLPNIHF